MVLARLCSWGSFHVTITIQMRFFFKISLWHSWLRLRWENDPKTQWRLVKCCAAMGLVQLLAVASFEV